MGGPMYQSTDYTAEQIADIMIADVGTLIGYGFGKPFVVGLPHERTSFAVYKDNYFRCKCGYQQMHLPDGWKRIRSGMYVDPLEKSRLFPHCINKSCATWDSDQQCGAKLVPDRASGDRFREYSIQCASIETCETLNTKFSDFVTALI